jgi:hypothetical protein
VPIVFKQDGFHFFFYSNEGDPREPVHIHIKKAGAEAKFWLNDDILLERSKGFDARTLRRLAVIVEEHRPLIESKWNEYFR